MPCKGQQYWTIEPSLKKRGRGGKPFFASSSETVKIFQSFLEGHRSRDYFLRTSRYGKSFRRYQYFWYLDRRYFAQLETSVDASSSQQFKEGVARRQILEKMEAERMRRARFRRVYYDGCSPQQGDIAILNSHKNPVFFIDTHRRQPDNYLKLREGKNKKGKILADTVYSNPLKEFRFRIRDGPEHSVVNEGSKKKKKPQWIWTAPGYPPRDESTGKDLAVYTNKSNDWNKEGSLIIDGGECNRDAEFEIGVLASFLSLYHAIGQRPEEGSAWVAETSTATSSVVEALFGG
ncbi:hypothetical protein H072_3947 [Dactylellina haptotyla CBS 200.50]|uniref:Uncharacterized protein n=1 Tax=Dactylellina haptotyla (strain CBS 200.50) TaxID=1284197 RepID=S8AGC7_DACHA|nr:hypothetical protein H072_3947 [Dactylellina haptotyla CBS 200.50]